MDATPFTGIAHYNQNFGTVMREYFTAERVCDVLHQCNRFGINTFNYFHAARAQADFERFLAEGGKMHLVAQGMADPRPSSRHSSPSPSITTGK